MAGEHNFSIDAGSTWVRSVTWKEDDVAVNITGYSAELRLSRGRGEEQEEIFSTGTGDIAITGAEGKLVITLTDEETAELTGQYFYVLEAESAGGVKTRLIEGAITINKGVA